MPSPAELEAQCPNLYYCARTEKPGWFACHYRDGVVHMKEGCGPLMEDTWCLHKCGVPKGIPAEDCEWLRARQRDVSFVLVRDAHYKLQESMLPDWTYETTVADTANIMSKEELRNALDEALIEGLDPFEAQRLKDLYAPKEISSDGP